MPNIENIEKFKFKIIVLVTFMLVIVIACLVLSFPTEYPSYLVSSRLSSESENASRIILRDEWMARPPKESLDILVLPVHLVIIAHTATQNCSNQAECTKRLKTMQNYHMNDRHFDDIIYNFLIGGDGNIYEGRGWNFQGAHTLGFNRGSICIAFIGTFVTLEPPEKQLEAAKWILEEGVRLDKLSTDFKVYGARQLVPTESPGSVLYEIIKKWKNWSNTI